MIDLREISRGDNWYALCGSISLRNHTNGVEYLPQCWVEINQGCKITQMCNWWGNYTHHKNGLECIATNNLYECLSLESMIDDQRGVM